MTHLTVNLWQTGTWSIVLTVTERIKNSTVGRHSTLRIWPGNEEMRSTMIACRFTALLWWFYKRGSRAGYLFCTVTEKNVTKSDQSWKVKDFTYFIRGRLRPCGVGPSDVATYGIHATLWKGYVSNCTHLYTLETSRSCRSFKWEDQMPTKTAVRHTTIANTMISPDSRASNHLSHTLKLQEKRSRKRYEVYLLQRISIRLRHVPKMF